MESEPDWWPPKYDLLGVGISRINLQTAAAAIFGLIEAGKKGYVTVTGVHGIIEAQDDPKLKEIFNRSFLTTPDGMPTVWMAHLLGHREVSRVYGPDLLLRLFDQGRAHGIRHFFYGGREGVAELLKERMVARFPGAEVVGVCCPPFRPLTLDEQLALIEKIRATRPHIIWIGVSTPKQDRFMAEYLSRLDCNVMIGVGAAFDFHAGLVRQAPLWVQRSGLEWFFRLCTEPRRLWRRYFTTNPRFIWLVLLWRCGLWNSEADRALPLVARGGRLLMAWQLALTVLAPLCLAIAAFTAHGSGWYPVAFGIPLALAWLGFAGVNASVERSEDKGKVGAVLPVGIWIGGLLSLTWAECASLVKGAQGWQGVETVLYESSVVLSLALFLLTLLAVCGVVFSLRQRGERAESDVSF